MNARLEAEAFGLQCQSASEQATRDREPRLAEGRHGSIRHWFATGVLSDPDVVLYAATVSVWSSWFIWLVGAFLLAYRPGFWYPQDIEFLAIPVLLGVANGLVHLRLLTNRSVTWRWMLLLSAADIALVTAGVVIGGGFRSFIFLAYYPTLAVFAVVFSSYWLSLAWTTAVAVAYAVVCLSVGSGLDLDAGNEKVLLARLAMMYTIVLGIGFIARFERIRWRSSVSRERELRRERIELSQTIHDTTAQTAYMIGLGIHRARNLAEESNQELKAALDATLELTMSAMWEAFGRDVAGVARAGGVSVRGRREPGVGDGPGCAWLRGEAGEAGELRRAAGHDGAVDGRV